MRKVLLLHIRQRGRLGFAAALLASGLAAGVAVAAGSASYSGHTSQGSSHAVSLTVDAQRRLGFKIEYNERCYSPSGALAGSSHGTFGFNPDAGVTVDSHGHFNHEARFTHVKTSGSPPQFFNSTDKVAGQIGSTTASGTFSFNGRFFSQRGVFKGSCTTGTLYWKATKH